jgi:hypothetical protein
MNIDGYIDEGGKDVLIRLSADQMDEILVQAIKSIYENSCSYSYIHIEDTLISKQVAAACIVLLKYTMITSNFEDYFKSQEE